MLQSITNTHPVAEGDPGLESLISNLAAQDMVFKAERQAEVFQGVGRNRKDKHSTPWALPSGSLVASKDFMEPTKRLMGGSEKEEKTQARMVS